MTNRERPIDWDSFYLGMCIAIRLCWLCGVPRREWGIL